MATLSGHSIEISGRERTYWLSPAPTPRAPLVVVLHGSGQDGRQMAAWTRLDVRGPEAGFACVFPDGHGRLWDDVGAGRRDGLDDGAFVSGVTRRLVLEGIAADRPPLLVGLSNGAFFAERLARANLVTVTGVALVAGSARVAARKRHPRPQAPAAFLCIAGTADRIVPYRGGRPKGVPAWLARRRARKVLLGTRDREVAPVEQVAGDWAAVSGCDGRPQLDAVAAGSGTSVERLSWRGPGHPPVVVHRVIGAGHGWPGGPPLPRFLLGWIPPDLDATAIVLEFAAAQFMANP